MSPRAALGNSAKATGGLMPGGVEHRLLLALRGVGGMTKSQITERFGNPQSGPLHRLRVAGLISMPDIGQKGDAVQITPTGLALTAPDGPLCRRKTLNTYCQL